MATVNKTKTTYTKDEAIALATDWFGGDDMAAETWVRKYALKSGENELLETTPDQMFDRLAIALAEVEAPDKQEFWVRKFREQLDGFNKVVMQGSPMMGLGNSFFRSTLSNCYVVPIKDDTLKGMFDALYQMAQIQAFRGGVGIDISPLRPEGTRVNNAAIVASGAWSWCDMYSYVTRKIGQNGRRGALMLTIDVSHPDIEKFIGMKSDLGQVTGANVSVKLTDDFMQAVEDDGMFDLTYEFDSSEYEPIRRTVRARDIWDAIIKNATEHAEPGLLMWDTIKRRSPADCYADYGFETICTNPCSEIPLSAYDSCRLTSINLTGFVHNAYTPDAYFDFEAFGESVGMGIRMLDNMVDIDIGLQPFEDQKNAARLGRRLGLGTHGLGDMLVMLNKRYDTDDAIDFVDGLYKFFKESAYSASIDLAEERGPFPLFDWEKEKDNEYISELSDTLKERMAKSGRRNIAMLTCAPTGSVSLISQTSSGIEPIFALCYDRRVKVFGSDIEKAHEVDAQGDYWRKYRVYHHAFANSNPDIASSDEFSPDNLKISEFHNHPRIKAMLGDKWAIADDIDWKKRVDMQGAITRHLDHASSSTINLPEGTSEETVSGIYQYAWRQNLKGVTVYVKNSRAGVLLTDDAAPQTGKRPQEIDADVHVVSNGDKYTIFVGLVDGKPYELFCVKHELAGVSDGLKGKIVKVKSRKYNFEAGPLVVRDINEHEYSDISAFTRLVSTALRNNVDIAEINEQLDKSQGNVTSLSKALNRVLAKYVGTITGRKCDACESTNTIFEEGCIRCLDCGHSKCS
jgi:ribonucleoside-diphosphate reductase alpha chain